MDGKIPIIRIEVDGMRERIGQALALHNDDFDTMIQIAVQKVFTVETIQAKIEMQVAKALDNAIDGLSGSFHVKEIMQDIVVQSLVKARDEIEKRKQGESGSNTTEKEEQKKVDDWNSKYQIGQSVIVTYDDKSVREAETRSLAYLLCESAVVRITDITGAYSLERVRAV